MSLPAYAMNQANFPELYERVLVNTMFRPFVEDLLDRVRFVAGDRLLDIACGTGIVARCATKRAGSSAGIVGADISAPMLEAARSKAPLIDWRKGNATALPVKDNERFTVVTCHQGLQFFSDKPAALREMLRVLEDGGRVGVGMWCSASENAVFGALQEVAERHLGRIPDQRFAFGDVDAAMALFKAAGFKNVQGGVVTRRIVIHEGATLVRMNAMALIGMSPNAAQLSEQDRMRLSDTLASESEAAAKPYMRNGAIECELRSAVVTAVA